MIVLLIRCFGDIVTVLVQIVMQRRHLSDGKKAALLLKPEWVITFISFDSLFPALCGHVQLPLYLSALGLLGEVW